MIIVLTPSACVKEFFFSFMLLLAFTLPSEGEEVKGLDYKPTESYKRQIVHGDGHSGTGNLKREKKITIMIMIIILKN